MRGKKRTRGRNLDKTREEMKERSKYTRRENSNNFIKGKKGREQGMNLFRPGKQLKSIIFL